MPWQMSAEAVAWRERTCREAANACTRRDNQRDATDYEVTMRAFKTIPFGNKLKWEFLVALWQMQWPDFVQIENLGVENTWLLRIAKACTRFKRITACGCASSGKTHCFSMYCYNMWKCFPTNASVYSSTTSGGAGEDRAWGAIKDLFSNDRYQWGKRLDSLQLITLDAELKDGDGNNNRDLRDAIKVVKIKPGQEGKNVIATMCGRKNSHVIWHCDEMAHMDLGVLEGRVNLFSNTSDDRFCQFIGTGNGPEEGDPLYIDAEPYGAEFPDGWRSVNRDVHEWWPTRTGICLYFNGDKSPNMRVPRGQKIPFSGLMNWKSKDEILLTAFGEENSAIFCKMFYGLPPSVDVPDKVVTHVLLQKFRAFEQPEWFGYEVKKLAGLDVGFRKDGDPCVIHFGDVGKSADDKLILGCDPDGRVLQPDQRLQEPFETQIGRRVVDECERRGCHDLAMDISSDGGMLLQAIEKDARARSYTLNVLPVSSLGSPDDTLFIPGDKRTAKEACDRKVSQLWLQFRNLVGMGAIRGLGPQSKAVRELCGRKFQTDAKRKFSIEPKKDYKVRLKHSPDHADSVIYLTHLALKNGLSGSEGRSSPTPKPKGDIFTDPNQPAPHYQGHTSRNAYSGR